MDNINGSYPSSTLWHSTSANWLNMPDEIWLNILSKLSLRDLNRVSQVCRRTYTLVQDPSLKFQQIINMMKGIFLRIGFAKPSIKFPNYKEMFRTRTHLIINDEGWDGKILIWNLTDKKERIKIKIGDYCKCIGITKEDNLIVSSKDSGVEAKTLRVFNILEEKFVEESSICKEALQKEEKGRYSFNTKTNKLIGLFPEGIIKIRDLMTNSEKTLTGKAEYNNIPPVLTEDGKLLLAAGKSIHVWDLAKGSLEDQLEGHEAEITSLAAIEGRIASGSKDETIKIWNLTSMECLATLSGHRASVKCLSFSPDGNILFSGAWEILKVWDLKSYSCLYDLQGIGQHYQMIFEEGKLIVSSINDSSAFLWDFGASNRQVWEQIAENFDDLRNDNQILMARFSRMPLEEQKKIYPNSFPDSLPTPFSRKRKAAAIRRYLKQLP